MYIKLLEKIIEKLKSSYSSVLPLVWSGNIMIKDAKTPFGGTDVIAFYDVSETYLKNSLTPSISSYTLCNVPSEDWLVYKIDGETFNFKNDPTGSGVRIRTANYAKVNGMTKTYKEIPMNSLDTL